MSIPSVLTGCCKPPRSANIQFTASLLCWWVYAFMKSNTPHHLRKSYRKFGQSGQQAGYSRRLSRRTFAAIKKANRRDA